MEKVEDTRFYEGCDREGPIRCIFLSEFHPVAGPKIVCQFPEDFVSKEMFDSVSGYIIPKPQLQRCTMTINALGHKVIGYPVRIDNPRYQRNAYLFNMCFVCDSWSKTVQYEPVVKKLGEHLILMEEENAFVSECSSRMPTMMAHLLHDLNTHRKATVVEGDTVMYLKVLDVRKDPSAVDDHDVPVFVSAVGLPRPGRTQSPILTCPGGEPGSMTLRARDENILVDFDAEWDLTSQQLLPYINGYNHIAKIAAESDVEKTLVKSLIQNLVYYGVVAMIPVLKFSNMYRATTSFSRLFREADLQQACLAFITPSAGSATASSVTKPTLKDAITFLAALKQGSTLKSVCEKYPASRNGTMDVRRLVVFALLHGLIKCLRKYPVYTNGSAEEGQEEARATKNSEHYGLRRYFTGLSSFDEICCKTNIEPSLLEELIEDDPDVRVIWM